MAQEKDRAESNAPPDLAQSVAGRANWSQRAVSPWVQRWLQSNQEASGRPRQTAFSERHTQNLVNRVFRQVEESRVWQPDIGSVTPEIFDRFAETIVERHQPVGNKYQVQAGQESPEGEENLPLAPGRQVMINVGPGQLPFEAERFLSAPSPFQTAPPATEQPAPPGPAIQRAPAPAAKPTPAKPPPVPSWSAPPVQRRRNVRAFSRVEVVTPGGKTPAGPLPAPSQPAIPAVQRAEEPPPTPAPTEALSSGVGSSAEPAPPAPVQRQVDQAPLDQEPVSARPQEAQAEPGAPGIEASLSRLAAAGEDMPAAAQTTAAAASQAQRRPEPQAQPPAIQRQAASETVEQFTSVPADPAAQVEPGQPVEAGQVRPAQVIEDMGAPFPAAGGETVSPPVQWQAEPEESRPVPQSATGPELSRSGDEAVFRSTSEAARPDVPTASREAGLASPQTPVVQRQAEPEGSRPAPRPATGPELSGPGDEAAARSTGEAPRPDVPTASPEAGLASPETPAVQRRGEVEAVPPAQPQIAGPEAFDTEPVSSQPDRPEATLPAGPQIEPVELSQAASGPEIVTTTPPAPVQRQVDQAALNQERDQEPSSRRPQEEAAEPRAPDTGASLSASIPADEGTPAASQEQRSPDQPPQQAYPPAIQRQAAPEIIEQALPIPADLAAQVEPGQPVEAGQVRPAGPAQVIEYTDASSPLAEGEAISPPVQRQVEPEGSRPVPRPATGPELSRPGDEAAARSTGETLRPDIPAAHPEAGLASPQTPVVQRQGEKSRPVSRPAMPGEPSRSGDETAARSTGEALRPDVPTASPEAGVASPETPAVQRQAEVEAVPPAQPQIAGPGEFDTEPVSSQPDRPEATLPAGLQIEPAGLSQASLAPPAPVQRQVDQELLDQKHNQEPVLARPQDEPAEPGAPGTGASLSAPAAAGEDMPAAAQTASAAASQAQRRPPQQAQPPTIQRQAASETVGQNRSVPADPAVQVEPEQPVEAGQVPPVGPGQVIEDMGAPFPEAGREAVSPPVQRQAEPEGSRPVPRPATPAEPSRAGDGAAARSTGEALRPDIPAARQEAGVASLETPVVQRRGEVAAGGLEQDVIARTGSGARLPLIASRLPASSFEGTEPALQTKSSPRPGAGYEGLTISRPMAPISSLAGRQGQADFGEDAAAGGTEGGRSQAAAPIIYRKPASAGTEPARPDGYSAYVQRAELPLPPVSRTTPAEAQRAALEVFTNAEGFSVVQREGEDQAEEANPEDDASNLDQLARQVYPLIKRMLAIERERRSTY